MNAEKLLHAIGLVGDDLISQADEPLPAAQHSSHFARWGALAACLCVVVGAALLIRPLFRAGSSGKTSTASIEMPAASPAEAKQEAAAVAEEAAAEEPMAEEAPPETAEAPAAEEEAKSVTGELSEKEQFEDGAAHTITVLGNVYEEILDGDPDYTPAELSEDIRELYIERGNRDRVYVLTWAETPAGVEPFPYTIAVYRSGEPTRQYRYVGKQPDDGLPDYLNLSGCGYQRVVVDDPEFFFGEEYPEECLGAPWYVTTDGYRVYAAPDCAELPETELSGADGPNDTWDYAVYHAELMVFLFADDGRAGCYLAHGGLFCFGVRYNEGPQQNAELSPTPKAETGENIWLTLDDGSRVYALTKSVVLVEGDMGYPEQIIRYQDGEPVRIYRFAGEAEAEAEPTTKSK